MLIFPIFHRIGGLPAPMWPKRRAIGTHGTGGLRAPVLYLRNVMPYTRPRSWWRYLYRVDHGAVSIRARLSNFQNAGQGPEPGNKWQGRMWNFQNAEARAKGKNLKVPGPGDDFWKCRIRGRFYFWKKGRGFTGPSTRSIPIFFTVLVWLWLKVRQTDRRTNRQLKLLFL